MGGTASLENYPKLKELSRFSQRKLAALRRDLEHTLSSKRNARRCCVVAVGSVARKEAFRESDLDFFLIGDKGLKLSYFDNCLDDIRRVVKKHMPNKPGTTDTFGHEAYESIEELVTNIGGDQDYNVKFTRRMLFLLEGAWLFNENKFLECRKRLLEKYIKERTGSAPLNYFFLNDIIRYYRTIATDYEFKVTEDHKRWGLRNIKLRFSRKLLYFSGLLVVAETTRGTQAERIEKTVELLNMTPVDRVQYLLDASIAERILDKYEIFSKKISTGAVRKRLEKVDRRTRHEQPDYRELRDLGKEFTDDLVAAIEGYSADERFQTALLF